MAFTEPITVQEKRGAWCFLCTGTYPSEKPEKVYHVNLSTWLTPSRSDSVSFRLCKSHLSQLIEKCSQAV